MSRRLNGTSYKITRKKWLYQYDPWFFDWIRYSSMADKTTIEFCRISKEIPSRPDNSLFDETEQPILFKYLWPFKLSVPNKDFH
jgi:hypothetical protein